MKQEDDVLFRAGYKCAPVSAQLLAAAGTPARWATDSRLPAESRCRNGCWRLPAGLVGKTLGLGFYSKWQSSWAQMAWFISCPPVKFFIVVSAVALSFCMLICQGLSLCCSETELTRGSTRWDWGKVSLHQKSNNNLRVKGKKKNYYWDSHSAVSFPGRIFTSTASDCLFMVFFAFRGYWNEAHNEQSSSESGKRLSVSFFSWAGFLWSTCDKSHSSEYSS